MNLYLLGRLKENYHYDVADGFVVRAQSSHRARFLASQQSGDEGSAFWTDATQSFCHWIGRGFVSDKEGVVLRDFNAG